MNPYSAYRHRNKVLAVMDQLLRTYGPTSSKIFLRVAFGRKWRKALNATYGEVPVEVALAFTATVLGSVLEKTLTKDQRTLARYAFEHENKAESISQHILEVLRYADALSPANRVPVLYIGYQALGALQGYKGSERDEFVRRKFIEDMGKNVA